MTEIIYLDTSVALAHLLAEDIAPPATIWTRHVVSSRLLQYEAWNRIHARGLATSHTEALQAVLDRIAFLELTPTVLARALEPFPTTVRTLDALHLASIEFLRERRLGVVLASYDQRMIAAADALGIEIFVA
jgi:hypothetical protein